MAWRAVQLDQNRFCCSICLELLKVPVSVPCGHNYCSECIEGYWNQDDQRGRFSCPQCRQTFIPRPILKKNTMLAEVVESLKNAQLQDVTPDRQNQFVLPSLPAAPEPAGPLPAEASQTSHPLRPLLKVTSCKCECDRANDRMVISLTWNMPVMDLTRAAVDSYQLYAFCQKHSDTNTTPQQQHWIKISEIEALPLPMVCDVATSSKAVSTYHFAVRVKDIYGRFGPFSEPQSTFFVRTLS